MSTNILLARHGQTNSNINGFYMGWSDEDLNATGYTQVNCLSSRLAGLPINAIYASPLRRAYNTASILAKPHGLRLQVLDGLTEIRLGDWQGRHMDEIMQRWPDLWRQWRTDPSEATLPNGESLHQVAGRATQAFEWVVKANQGKQVVIVTHEVIVKVIVAYILGAPNSIYRRFEINNASLSIVRVANNSYQLAVLNDTSHIVG